jgi:hypothetical protein
MLNSYIRATKLRCWLSRPDCPPVIRECKVLFDRMYAPKSATKSDEELAEDPFDDSVHAPISATATAVPEDLYALIKRRTAVLRARLRFDGVVYSRASTHVGNSQVFFYPRGDRLSSPIPGSIRHIYASPAGELVLAVQRYIPLGRDDHTIDPFAMYPGFPAKLYSSSLSCHLETVKVAWVVGHFARWKVSSDQAVILSLCRVSYIPFVSEVI